MNWLSRIFNYPLLAAQLQRERELHATELEALRSDHASEIYKLEEQHEAAVEQMREDYGELFKAFTRVIDRVGQKGGLLPIFEERPQPNRVSPEHKEMARKGPLARAAKGQRQGDALWDNLNDEVSKFVQENGDGQQ
jgi:hypothetical protein